MESQSTQTYALDATAKHTLMVQLLAVYNTTSTSRTYLAMQSSHAHLAAVQSRLQGWDPRNL